MLNGKTILLGISGGIAAYKAAELVRFLVKDGASVHVVMTANAQNFITPLTLQTLSGNQVGTDLFNREYESQIGHIRLARTPDLVILAPATANLIAKMAAGIADDYLTTILLATTAPVLLCPAMNVTMYEHPITQRNLDSLRVFKYHILEPEVGELACKEEGAGRLVDLSVILETTRRLLTPASLERKRILVSAGPTWEPFDPVRFISNPSSGKMGYALASIAYRRGAEVHLVSGPSPLPAPHGVCFRKVITAHEMRDAIIEHAPQMDAVIMAAAVGDYRPLQIAPQKIKKLQSEENITLIKNPDILGHLGKSRSTSQRPVLVGFAAETENLIENATEKLIQKNLDFIVANNLTQSGSGFGCDTNQVKIIDRKGDVSELPAMTKEEVAEQVFDRVEALLSITEP
jgi:phosphopantothenoylcysteine decarboxylase / phosphopantothenate---cysteine ligase